MQVVEHRRDVGGSFGRVEVGVALLEVLNLARGVFGAHVAAVEAADLEALRRSMLVECISIDLGHSDELWRGTLCLGTRQTSVGCPDWRFLERRGQRSQGRGGAEADEEGAEAEWLAGMMAGAGRGAKTYGP